MIRLLALLVALAWPAALPAQERILAYDSQIEVRADGSLGITEHIRVRAEGRNIRRGIYRDFPTRYRDRFGNRVVVDFDMIEVLRDGKPEPWFTERIGNGVRINTGNDDFLPVPAEYTYTLRYDTTRQLGFFEDHDELYFTAIGHGWDFPIDSGSVRVRLPGQVPADDMRAEAYSGPFGAQGNAYRVELPQAGTAQWTLTAPLDRREGFTIVLGFPKGIVAPPTRAQQWRWLLNDNRGLLVALAGLLTLLTFCAVRWHKVGRDPAPGTIIARYDPPSGYSPAELRYMKRMGYDHRCFSSDLLDAAVAGAVTIHRDKKLLRDHWRLERGAQAAMPDNDGSRTLIERLLPDGNATLELRNTNAGRIQQAIGQHTAQIKQRFQPAMFSRNGSSIGIAAAIAVVSALLALAVGVGTSSGLLLVLPVILAMIVVVVVFAVLVAAPTPTGRRLLDEIEGFRRYLHVAEKQDLKLLEASGTNEPQLDAARFERLLPYAVALDVEDAWTRKFTLAVGAAAAAAATSAITWYHGSGISDMGSLTRAVGSSLTSQISSSSTPPGSSSGGGGGGFSGGGGGGGGGGGR